MSIDETALISFSPLHRMQWEDTQSKFVILYPEGVVELNTTAAEILKRCDGSRTFHQLVQDLESAFDTRGLEDDVREALETALKNGWIRLTTPNHEPAMATC